MNDGWYNKPMCVTSPHTPWVSKTQNEIHISKKNSNRQHTPPAGAHMQNIFSPSTGVVRPHTARTWEQHMHLYITLVPSENRTQLAQEDGQFSLLPAHVQQHPCSCARIHACSWNRHVSVCVLPVSPRQLYLPIQDIRLTVLCQTLLARLSTDESMTRELLTH